MAGPLSGYQILDLSRILAGPWLGQLLADLGATVWKIERPFTGDDTRHWGPPHLDGTTESAYFLSANRGKHSICVDIATQAGADIVRSLVRKTDVLIENYKVGDMKRYGLDYEALRLIKPDIVYCSITGYGQTGPMKNVAGYDMAIQAISGLMSITGEADDKPGGGPQKVGVPISDLLTGMYSATGVLSALLHRERTGEGQHIDMALLDVQLAALANQNLNYLTTGKPPRRYGNAHPNIVPYQVFRSSNGSFVLAVGNDQHGPQFTFQNLTSLLYAGTASPPVRSAAIRALSTLSGVRATTVQLDGHQVLRLEVEGVIRLSGEGASSPDNGKPYRQATWIDPQTSLVLRSRTWTAGVETGAVVISEQELRTSLPAGLLDRAREVQEHGTR